MSLRAIGLFYARVFVVMRRRPPRSTRPAPRFPYTTLVRSGLQRDVGRGAGIIDGAADQRLHRRVAAARVDQFDVEALIGEMAAGARHLVDRKSTRLNSSH